MLLKANKRLSTTYCKTENKVALGFVKGLNNKIRVIQRRSYGLRNEECLRLKVLTCMLPPIWNQAKITHSRTRRSCNNKAIGVRGLGL